MTVAVIYVAASTLHSRIKLVLSHKFQQPCKQQDNGELQPNITVRHQINAKIEIHIKSQGTDKQVQSSLENLHGWEFCHISGPLFPIGIVLIIKEILIRYYCILPVESCPLNVHLQL